MHLSSGRDLGIGCNDQSGFLYCSNRSRDSHFHQRPRPRSPLLWHQDNPDPCPFVRRERQPPCHLTSQLERATEHLALEPSQGEPSAAARPSAWPGRSFRHLAAVLIQDKPLVVARPSPWLGRSICRYTAFSIPGKPFGLARPFLSRGEPFGIDRPFFCLHGPSAL